jgi:hypothetical protein
MLRAQGNTPRDKDGWPLLVFRWPLLVFLAAVVFGIELVQVWFPPRTVSQNDIFAGWCGAAGGMLAWVFFGETLVWSLEKFVSREMFSSFGYQLAKPRKIPS